MDSLKEGFYVARMRDEPLLCYVYTGEEGKTFVAFPNGVLYPVLFKPSHHTDYVLRSNLIPVSPDKHLDDALSMIKFIYQHQGRLKVVSVLRPLQRGQDSTGTQTLPKALFLQKRKLTAIISN